MQTDALRPVVEAVERDLQRLVGGPVIPRDGSFSEGQASGTRIAACVARLAALELLDTCRWWNRWRHRIMARALVDCADEMEDAADASSDRGAGPNGPGAWGGHERSETTALIRDPGRGSRCRPAVLDRPSSRPDDPAAGRPSGTAG